ncbi:MAG: hypothetical protein R3E66_02720 [bacterium]
MIAPACTFTDGSPWGQVDMNVQVGFDDAGRQKSDGLHTSKDYVVVLDRLDVDLVAAVINTSADSVTLSFDPASPPDGYGLCHNGHCHADDGRLVDYADIEAELAGGAATGQALVQVIDATPNLLDGSTVALGECASNCELGRGYLQTVGLQLGTLSLAGRVFDKRVPSRLPDEGVPVTGTFALDTTLSEAIGAEVGRDEPAGIDLDVRLTAAAPFLDALDFAALVEDGSVALERLSAEERAAFIEKTRQELNLDVTVERREL